MRRLFVILIACVWASLPVAGFSATGQRIALVIGNGNYLDAPLRNPVNDATDMASALKKLGFSVTLYTDATQRTMEESIRAFGSALHSGGVGLFYYAGHGIQSRGTNYLIPVHAEIKSESDVKYESVDAGRVLAQMAEAGNSLNIIILDACRNNPFARSFRSSEIGLAKMDAPTGSILAYATAPGSVAADGRGRNGLYTEMLLKHMQTSGIELGRMFRKVRVDVIKASKKKQVPWESSSLTGDFYFVPARGVTVTEMVPVQKKPTDASVSPAVLDAKIVDRDGHYVKFGNGIVLDNATGLEWYAGPNYPMTWNQADIWVKKLEMGGKLWRLPTVEELSSLHQDGVGNYNMTPLLNVTGDWFWSNERFAGANNWVYFNFIFGNYKTASPYVHPWVLAVRKRK